MLKKTATSTAPTTKAPSSVDCSNKSRKIKKSKVLNALDKPKKRLEIPKKNDPKRSTKRAGSVKKKRNKEGDSLEESKLKKKGSKKKKADKVERLDKDDDKKPDIDRKEDGGSERRRGSAAKKRNEEKEKKDDKDGKDGKDEVNDSKKEQKKKESLHPDVKADAGKAASGSTPLPNIPNVGTSPQVPPADDDSDEDEESSGAKTPPDKPEPNEVAANEDIDAPLSQKIPPDFVAKGEVVAVSGFKVSPHEPLKGVYGQGVVVVKEMDRKMEEIAVGQTALLKFEKNTIKLKKLFIEIEILKFAISNQKTCVPFYLESGEANNFQVLLTESIGPSLGELNDKLNGFSHATTLRIALITLDLLRTFHAMLFLHRDVRPHSFAIGREGSRQKIVVSQMGFARKFGIKKEIEPEEKCELEMKKPKFRTRVWHPRKNVCFVGSVKYAPRSSHLRKEHTRRDDLESWYYMIYCFLNKGLPWKTTLEKDKVLEQKDGFILDIKISEEVNKKFGIEMTNICEYFGVQNFFEMEPDYGYIELSVLNMLKEANKGASDKFDWEMAPGVFQSSSKTDKV